MKKDSHILIFFYFYMQIDQTQIDLINPFLDLEAAEKLQDFQVTQQDKLNLGIIYTPFSLIKNIFSLLPDTIFENPNHRWLDMGAGTGYFSIYLYHRLFQSLKNQILDPIERKKHIIENMLYMAEIKPDHIEKLENIFGPNANIISGDFLSFTSFSREKISENNIQISNFNIIIGNPPYNCNGQIKTPTNIHVEKSQDGKTTWPDFIKKAISLLDHAGYLLSIIPSIWLKPDKAEINKIMTHPESNIRLVKLHNLSANETNKIFNYQAQTPTSYFLAKKNNNKHNSPESSSSCQIYDKSLQTYIEYPITPQSPIPLSSISIIKKLKPFIDKIGHIKVYKTNMPSSKSKFSIAPTIEYPHQNIKTCIFAQRISVTEKREPILIYNYSNIAQTYAHQNKPKLILAHKMFGFPYLDKIGKLGISYRDNYVITDKSLQKLKILQRFLSTKLILAIYDATRYRMRYLEKYAFELIPDITKLNDFPTNINDQTIADYFNFSQEEREIINKYPNYQYF